MPSLRLTKAAGRDIAELKEHSLAEFGSATTEDYLLGLHEALGRLVDFPDMGISHDDLRPGTRSLRYRSHRIYYRATPHELVIQRILHHARLVRRGMIA